MARGKRVNGIYSEKLKAIRPFVSFDYDLRKPLHPSQKRKINRYFEAIDQAQAGGARPYRSRNIKRVRKVQRAAGNEFEGLKDIDVAFVPHNKANPVDVRIDEKGRVQFKARNFRTTEIPLRVAELARDPAEETNRAIRESGSNAKYFQVLTIRGYRTKATKQRNRIGSYVAQLVNQYSRDPNNPGRLNNGKTESQRYDKWLVGLYALDVSNQTELDDFLLADKERRERRNKKRKAFKERQRVAKGRNKRAKGNSRS